jgi:putative membrane protein
MSAEPEPGWQRLSVGMLFVQPVRELIRALPFLIALVFAGNAGDGQPPWSLIGVGVVVGVGVARWITTRYRITDSAVEVQRGLIARKRLTVPRDRVRTVDVSAHPLQRVLGLAKVEIGTGTSDRKAAALALDGLPAASAVRLRSELLHRRLVDAALGATPQDTPEDELVRFRPSWIRFAPATLSGAVTALFLVGLGWRITGEAHLHPDRISVVRSALDHLGRTALWIDVVEVGVAGLALIAVLSVAGYVFAFWGFRLSRHAGGSLHVARGLLTTRATSIEERRIRGVERSEPLLLRLTGGARCLAISTGLRVGRGSERGGTLLVPPSPRAVAIAAESAVLGSSVPGAAHLTGRGAAARRRRYLRALVPSALVVSVLACWALVASLPWSVVLASLVLLPAGVAIGADRFASLGYALVAEAGGRRWLITRYGSLVRRRCILDADGVIGVTIRQSLFQRRTGLTTVIATTAAGRQQYPVADLTDAAAGAFVLNLLPAAGEFVAAPAPEAQSQVLELSVAAE